ncbi:hypothetical protein ABZX82_01770 [Streptomyces griseoflavus]|uniref:hypothetical protein n=1 Tax=Streptomyces griseoflavus TaxID=35619 RepID=UPI0033B2EE7D
MRHLHLVPDEPEHDPEPHEVTATPDWPPVAIPGRPSWWRHYENGRQADLPHNNRTATAGEEATHRA